MNIRRSFSCLVPGIYLFLSPAVYAQLTEVPHSDGLLYYKIGGGRHISLPPSLNVDTLNFSASAGSTALNCGRFDLATSVEASLDNLAQGADDAINALEAAASAAIVNLPGYLLQRANPGLYDLFQNALLRAQESFSLATKSCERMQYEISQNINPYAEWITLSRGDSWKRSVGLGERNIHTAATEAETGHNDGVTWLGGISRGGVGQAPIRVLGDVASAGLNTLSGRAPEVSESLPVSAPLARHFSGPSEVSEWIERVLGDVEVSVCDDCDVGTIPGKGLMPLVEETASDVAVDLEAMVQDTRSSNRENLEGVSAPGVAISHQVIQAIRGQSPEERVILIDKLAQEIAEARALEQAMIVRRLLLTGRKNGDVNAINMAVMEVDRAVKELEEEIDNVVFEKRVRSELVTETVVALLLQHHADRQSAITMPPLLPADQRLLDRGAVNP